MTSNWKIGAAPQPELQISYDHATTMGRLGLKYESLEVRRKQQSPAARIIHGGDDLVEDLLKEVRYLRDRIDRLEGKKRGRKPREVKEP